MMSGEQTKSPAKNGKEDAVEAETPPDERRLISKFTACLGTQLKQVEQNVSRKIDSRMDTVENKFENLDNDFVKLTKNVQRHNELARETASKLERLTFEQQTFRNEDQQNGGKAHQAV